MTVRLCNDDIERIRAVRAILCDLDGTIYLGDSVFPWSVQFVDRVRETGRRILFFTNNSARDGDHYARKLTTMGIPCGASDIITSGDATVDYLRRSHENETVLALGTPAFEVQIDSAGIQRVSSEDDNPDVVVVAFDLNLTYEKLRAACRSIDRGAAFVATHPDYVCPDPDGPIPDCGAICAAVTSATGVTPTVIGKPHSAMVDAALGRLGVDAKDAAIAGDRLYTDIRMGRDFGLLTILTLSGETTLEMLSDSDDRPDIVVENLGELTPLYVVS